MKGLRESLSDVISDISPEQTPFFSGAGTGMKAKQTLVEWQTDSLAAAAANASSVIFTSPGDWTLTQHHFGFTEPAENKTVKIEVKTRVKALKEFKGVKKSLVKGGKIYFHDVLPSVVPRRPIWPEGGQLARLVGVALKKWNKEFEIKLRRVR